MAELTEPSSVGCDTLESIRRQCFESVQGILAAKWRQVVSMPEAAILARGPSVAGSTPAKPSAANFDPHRVAAGPHHSTYDASHCPRRFRIALSTHFEMGARTVSPGGALLRSSRMFALPKPLREPPSTPGENWSPTATQSYPQHQSITSPFASREKGDWGLKRALPLRQTMATSTPLVRVKQLDTVEKITDYASAADHSLSLEKFGEMRIAMSIPQPESSMHQARESHDGQLKSVFEEDMDFTTIDADKADDKRWKFRGPWLARMSEGDFTKYLDKSVRPKRAEFRELLRQKLAKELTIKQNTEAREAGLPQPPWVEPRHITEEQFTQYLRSLRNDRVTLYDLVSKFLDLAPLGKPLGFAQTGVFFYNNKKTTESPYGKSGPPPSHPSAGISYLRTNAVMDNHPVYGPQAHRSPVLSRIIHPRQGSSPAKIGIGGFVAGVPAGDNDFNIRPIRGRGASRKPLNGISHLDITNFGGAKAYVEPYTATVDPDGKVVVSVRETGAEAQVIAREALGQTKIYKGPAPQRAEQPQKQQQQQQGRMERVADEVLDDVASAPKTNSYGLDSPDKS